MTTAKDGAPCLECGVPAEHDHHVIPKSLGGTATVPLCHVCHGRAHSASLPQKSLVLAGIRRAQAAGVHCGRPPEHDWNTLLPVILARRKAGISVRQIAKDLAIPLKTVQKRVYGQGKKTD